MTDMTKLQTELKRLRELRERATPGKWLAATKPPNNSTFYIYPDNGTNYIPALEMATFFKSGNYLAEEDVKLTIESANRWLQLIEAVECACDALVLAEKHMRFCDSMDANKTNEPTLNIFISPALAKIEQLICGGAE